MVEFTEQHLEAIIKTAATMENVEKSIIDLRAAIKENAADRKKSIEDLKKACDKVTEDHEKRIAIVEEWKADHDGEKRGAEKTAIVAGGLTGVAGGLLGGLLKGFLGGP